MDFEQRVNTVINGAIADNRIIGTSVVIARAGKIIYQRAAGYADREAEISTRLDSIFRFASLSKLIVATTVLVMVDKGLIDLEAPITNYLPYFTPKLADGSQPNIFIHQLLAHAGGVGSDLSVTDKEALEPRFTAVQGDYWHLSLEDNLERLAQRPLVYAPGTGWHYGFSIDVLGAVVARIVGGTVQDAVTKFVTGPLGMTDTLFGVADASRLTVPYGDNEPEPARMGDPHAVKNYWENVTTFYPQRIFDTNAFQAGGGGTAGTASDFMKLLIAIERKDSTLLSDSLVARAGQNAIGTIARDTVYGGYGFGFFGEVVDGSPSEPTPRSDGTFGWGGHFGNSWFIDPKAELAVVALTNTALEGFNGAYPKDLCAAIYG